MVDVPRRAARLALQLSALSLIAVVAAPAAAQDEDDEDADLEVEAFGDEYDLTATDGGEGEAAPRAGTEDDEDEDEDEESGAFYGQVAGEYQFRLNLMGDIPLTAVESRGFGTELGQNLWGEQWFRFTGEIGIRDKLKLIGQIDIADGVLFGDYTEGVDRAEQPRDDTTAFTSDGIQPRWLYLEWLSPIGLFRAGLQPSHWGLGILANDGTREPPFGDYRFGDRAVRLAFATKPGGEDSDFYVALAGDLVFNDLTADVTDGDRALQGILSAFYRRDERQIGVYAVYRSQRSEYDTGIMAPTGEDGRLDIFAFDAFGRWDWDEPSGGTAFIAAEGAVILGETSLTLDVPSVDSGDDDDDVRQFLVAGQIGRLSDDLDVVVEVGYTSGDSNTEDDYQRRATMDPDHRIGLIMFPEVVAWQTARSASLAGSPDLFGRPSPGSELLPTNGGVSGATYLFPYAVYRPLDWLDIRLGMVWARASADVVDPYRQRSASSSSNYMGGDASARDMGIEFDGAVRLLYELPHGVRVNAGIEGGIFLPGHAFDDSLGAELDPIGMFRLRAGLRF